MANVKDDEFETLDFADEAEYAEGEPDEDEGPGITYEIAEMIADWFGRSVIDADLELAAAIIERISKS